MRRLMPGLPGGVNVVTCVALGFAILVGVAACSSPSPAPADVPLDKPATDTAAEAPAEDIAPLTIEALGNIEYDYVDGKATLVDGVYEEKPAPDSATFIVQLTLHETSAMGDLNGDGTDDAAVILVNSPGGSGVFEYLAVVLNAGGTPVNVATTLLGDRVRIDGMAIAAGQITLDVTTHGPDDPLCCPSQAATWVYALEGDALVKQAD